MVNADIPSQLGSSPLGSRIRDAAKLAAVRPAEDTRSSRLPALQDEELNSCRLARQLLDRGFGTDPDDQKLHTRPAHPAMEIDSEPGSLRESAFLLARVFRAKRIEDTLALATGILSRSGVIDLGEFARKEALRATAKFDSDQAWPVAVALSTLGHFLTKDLVHAVPGITLHSTTGRHLGFLCLERALELYIDLPTASDHYRPEGSSENRSFFHASLTVLRSAAQLQTQDLLPGFDSKELHRIRRFGARLGLQILEDYELPAKAILSQTLPSLSYDQRPQVQSVLCRMARLGIALKNEAADRGGDYEGFQDYSRAEQRRLILLSQCAPLALKAAGLPPSPLAAAETLVHRLADGSQPFVSRDYAELFESFASSRYGQRYGSEAQRVFAEARQRVLSLKEGGSTRDGQDRRPV